MATAYWTVGAGRGELRDEPLSALGEGEVLVTALHSGVSRGTELLVHRGGVPDEVADRMRAPHQEGGFPWPVKYGYLSVGRVAAGPPELTGRVVFCLYPHQDRYVVPAAAVTPVPGDVPARRAVLAGTVETAVNGLWDAAPRLGDRVAVVGGGLVGVTVAALLRRFPVDRLELVDVDPARAELAAGLGVPFALPAAAAGDCDVVLHCSATGAGLSTALGLLGDEGEVVDLSWYGAGEVAVALGAGFHARRLSVRASQVGSVAAARRARRTTGDRLALALDLLRDPAFDLLLGAGTPFADLPETMRRLAAGETDPAVDGLCTVVDYDACTG